MFGKINERKLSPHFPINEANLATFGCMEIAM
jgi:hypothetical protein